MDVENAIRDYLPEIVHMSLATSSKNKPWVCEVHFAFDDNLNLYFRSLLSRRHSKDIMSNPRVAGNIVTQHQIGDKVRGVYFEGTCNFLESQEDIELAFKVLSKRLKVGKEILEEAARDDGHKFFKVHVEKYYLFDSRESNPSQKYELEWK